MIIITYTTILYIISFCRVYILYQFDFISKQVVNNITAGTLTITYNAMAFDLMNVSLALHLIALLQIQKIFKKNLFFGASDRKKQLF